MIKLEVIEPFTLERFGELKNIERVGVETPGRLNIGDKFECEKELANYLLGDNPIKKAVVKVIEVVPEKEPLKVIEGEEAKKIVVDYYENLAKPKKKKKSTK